MNSEVADTLLDLTAVYAEVFPHQNPDNVKFSDTQIAQVVLMRRELAMFEKRMKWRTSRTADPE